MGLREWKDRIVHWGSHRMMRLGRIQVFLKSTTTSTVLRCWASGQPPTCRLIPTGDQPNKGGVVYKLQNIDERMMEVQLLVSPASCTASCQTGSLWSTCRWGACPAGWAGWWCTASWTGGPCLLHCLQNCRRSRNESMKVLRWDPTRHLMKLLLDWKSVMTTKWLIEKIICKLIDNKNNISGIKTLFSSTHRGIVLWLFLHS